MLLRYSIGGTYMAGPSASHDNSAFLSVDWGNSRLRVSLVEADGRLLDTQASDRGAAAVAAESEATPASRAKAFAIATMSCAARNRSSPAC